MNAFEIYCKDTKKRSLLQYIRIEKWDGKVNAMHLGKTDCSLLDRNGSEM